jgi:hypothetical protein
MMMPFIKEVGVAWHAGHSLAALLFRISLCTAANVGYLPMLGTRTEVASAA